MAWLTVNRYGVEQIHECEPKRVNNFWESYNDDVFLPDGSIEKLIGRTLTWDDEPVEI